MRKRNITVFGIGLILIAIGIVIALGGEANAAPVSVGALGSRALSLEAVDLQQRNLAPAHLEESAAMSNDELGDVLGSGLNSRLNSELNLLTASSGVRELRLDAADRALDVTALAHSDRLDAGLERHLDELLLNA